MAPNPLGELSEILTEYSESERRLTFQAVGFPAIVLRAQNSAKVSELREDKSLVTLVLDMELWGPFKLFHPLPEPLPR